jgi:hypothetical protein
MSHPDLRISCPKLFSQYRPIRRFIPFVSYQTAALRLDGVDETSQAAGKAMAFHQYPALIRTSVRPGDILETPKQQ